MDNTELIAVHQLPVSQSLLQSVRANASQRLNDARSLVCTRESLLSVKSARSETQKEYDALEEWRKEIKEWVMVEYKRFEADYKTATKDYVDALALYSSNIKQTESAIKQDCEDGLRDYFSELCAVRHLDWLEYERAGIKVDMASARAKTPGKLRRQLAAFVQGIGESVDRISKMDYAEEIMVEFRQTLNEAASVYAVADRHRRIEEERAAQEARKAVLEQEAEAVHRVEVLDPPVSSAVPAKNPDDVFESFTYTVFNVKRSQLWKIRDLLESEGIKYE